MDSEIYREKSKKTFDTDAQVYDQTSNGKHSAKLYSSVVKEIKSADYRTLLDVGCGTGNVLALLPSEKILYGIDLSDKMIKIAQNRLPTTNFVIGDSENLPWKDATFDVINCTDSFHHYPHPDNVLKEMFRVLKNGGRLVIADPFYSRVKRFCINSFIPFSNSGDFRVYSQEEITSLLKNAGFLNIHFKALECEAFIVTAEATKG